MIFIFISMLWWSTFLRFPGLFRLLIFLCIGLLQKLLGLPKHKESNKPGLQNATKSARLRSSPNLLLCSGCATWPRTNVGWIVGEKIWLNPSPRHKGGRLHHLMSSIPPPRLGLALERNAAKSIISSDWRLATYSHWPTIVLHVFTLGHLFIQLVILRLQFGDMGLELRSIPRKSTARDVKLYGVEFSS